MTIRIAFSGAQGVGKTTLCQEVFHYLKEILPSQASLLISGIARDLNVRGIGIDTKTSSDEYCLFVAEYVKRLLNAQADYVIHDRTLLDSLSYMKTNGNASAYFYEMMEQLVCWYIKDIHHYFYLPIEFPIQADGVRSQDEEYRRRVDAQILGSLRNLNINFTPVRGSIEQRLQIVTEVLLIQRSSPGNK